MSGSYSTAMFQKPRQMGHLPQREGRGDVPETPRNGAFGNVGAGGTATASLAMRPALSRLGTRSRAARTVSWVCTGKRRWFRETELPENIAGSRGNAPIGRDGERIRCQGVFRPTPPKVPSDGTPNSSVRCAGAPGERSHGSWNSPWRQAQAHGAPGVECVSRRSSRLDASASGGRSCPGLVAGANGVMGAYRESTLAPRWKVSKEQGGSRETPLRDVGRRNSPARACSSAGPGELGAERPQWEVQPGSGERRPSPPHAVMCNVTLAPRPRREAAKATPPTECVGVTRSVRG